MDQHKCPRKHFPYCCKGLPKCVAYASFPVSALPISRQEIQQSGFEGLLLRAGSDTEMCLWAASGSVALLTCSARSSERTCSIWGKYSLSESAVPLLCGGVCSRISRLLFLLHCSVPVPSPSFLFVHLAIWLGELLGAISEVSRLCLK